MKGKLRSMWRVAIALVLIAGLSLVAAVPAVADSPDVGYEFNISTGETAEWSDAQASETGAMGSYSVKLVAGTDGNDWAQVILTPPAAITLADMATITSGWSWWYYIETVGAGDYGTQLELRFESATDPDGYAEMTIMDEAYGPGEPVAAAWTKQTVTSATTGVVFGIDEDGNSIPQNAGSAFEESIADLVAYMVAADDNAGAWVLTEVRAGLGWIPVGPQTAYVDDVTIDGTLYELEPIFLDAEYYSVGDTVEVTVPNFKANTDPIRINPVAGEPSEDSPPYNWSVTATSTSDASSITIDLEETGANTGVFTGSFTTTGTLPVAEDEVYVQDGDTITVKYGETQLADWGAGADSLTTLTALVDDTAPTIGDTLVVGSNNVTTPGTIIFDSTPEIVATVADDPGSGIDEESIVMMVNGDAVTTTYVTGTVTYDTCPELDPGTIVEVTVDVKDKAGNDADTASWSFTIASAFNVSLDADEIEAVDTTTVKATFTDVAGVGPDGPPFSDPLDTVKVTLSGPGVDLASGDFDGSGGEGDGTVIDATSLTFAVTPEQAGTITVTFVGTFDAVGEAAPVVVTKTLDIDVTGFLVAETWDNVELGDVDAISMTITTKAGTEVNTGIVTITAPAAGGFEKDVDGVAGDESFTIIVIDGSAGQITYDAGDPEDFVVMNGYYEVTGVKFAEVGAVNVLVTTGAIPMAEFPTAFTVLGNPVYTLSFDPTKLTAGVDLDALDITITDEAGEATDVDTITIDGTDFTGGTLTNLGNGVYRVDPDLISEEKIGEDALVVMAKNADATKYGTATLEVGLPTVSYVITDASDIERNVMLTNTAYTLDVTVNDALGNPLSGFLWIGTYDEETETFGDLADSTITNGIVEDLAVVAPEEAGSLVWKIGSDESLGVTQALLLEPAIAVEEFGYDLNPTEATVGVDTTYTVTDNYLALAGNLDVEIVTPGGDVVNKVTTPVGTFKYTAPEAGDYYVSVELDVGWQAPITVTVGAEGIKGDFNGDSKVDFDDFVAFGDCYGSELGDANYNAIGDFDDSGVIDFDDFVAFGDVYGTSW